MIRPVRPLIAVLLLVAAAVSAGCGERDTAAPAAEKERMRLVLDFFPNADHAPIYAALEAGEFDRAGIDLQIVTPPDPSAPLRLLEAGRVDLAISYEPELLLARDEGADAVAVAALVQEPLTSLMSLEGSGVSSVRDLRGKTVGTAGIPYQTAYLRTILEEAGIPQGSVRRVDVGFNLGAAMVAGRVDATLGAFWNYEGTDLERRGRDPIIMRVEELGVPEYDELIFVANTESLDTDGAARLRRFIQAVRRGAEIARSDPERAARAVVAANDDLDLPLQLAVVRRTADLFFPDDAGQPFGWLDPEAWRTYADWMREEGLLERDPLAAGSPITNEFLPGEGLETTTADP